VASRPIRIPGRSSDDVHGIVYFKRHPIDDPSEATPGYAALESWPEPVQNFIKRTIEAVAQAPPKSFRGSGQWKVMKDEMSGFCEARDKQKKYLYRLFCIIDTEILNSTRPVIAIIDGRVKEIETVIALREYRKIIALGDEYRSRNPRSIMN